MAAELRFSSPSNTIPINRIWRVKPTYNVGDFGQDIFIPFMTRPKNWNNDVTFTWPPTGTTVVTSGIPSGNAVVDETFPVTPLSAFTSIGAPAQAANTDIDFIWEWTPDMTAWVYKLSLGFCVFLNTTVNAGAVTTSINTVQFIMKANTADNTGSVAGFPSGTSAQTLLNVTYSPVSASQSGTTSVAVIINDQFPLLLKSFKNSPITFEIKTSSTFSTATSKVGVLPIYNNQAISSGLFTNSGAALHIHAALDHSDIPLNDQSEANKVDYSGVG